MEQDPKLGLVIAGAAACIGQEYALIEALFRECLPSRHPERPPLPRPAVIAGTSSGALLAVCLNAILDGNSEFHWASMMDDSDPDNPRGILATLRNRDIYSLDLLALFRGYLLGTGNFEKLLKTIVHDKMGIQRFGELSTPTIIAVVERATGTLHRLDSREHGELDLVEILLATTAMPIALPPRTITGYADGALFVDGGTGTDGVPVLSLWEEHCDAIYVVGPQRDMANVPVKSAGHKLTFRAVWDSIRGDRDALVSSIQMLQSLQCLDYLMTAAMMLEIQAAPGLAEEAWIYMPGLSKQYNILNFGDELAQYREAKTWAQSNGPTLLGPTGDEAPPKG